MLIWIFLWFSRSILCSASQTIYTSFMGIDPFTDNQGWTILNPKSTYFTNCAGVDLIGGYQGFDQYSVMIQLFELPPHYKIRVTFLFYILQQAGGDFICVYIDDQNHCEMIAISTNLCSSGNDNYGQVSVEFAHNGKTAIISIQSSITSTGYWGIREFSLDIDQCPQGCQICQENQISQECNKWSLFTETWISHVASDILTEGWYAQNVNGSSYCAQIAFFGGINMMGSTSQIYRNFQLPIHSQILIKVKFAKIDKWVNEFVNIKIDSIDVWTRVFANEGQYQSLCGLSDGYEAFYQITIQQIHSSQNLRVEFHNTLEPFIGKFQGLRDFQLFIYNEFPQNLCGDGIIQFDEQCDDGNIIPFDGCYTCQYSCQVECSECVNGMCLNCIDNYSFDITIGYCVKKIIFNLSQNQNENLKEIPNGELQIKFQNQICQIGWYLNDFNECQTFCGDNIIVGREECEITQLNCSKECKLMCLKQCKICKFGICQLCDPGYQLLNGQCYSKCNNLTLQMDEECDDGNLIRFDGCHQCKNECQYSCLSCNIGQCWMCDEGYILLNGKCETYCGDGLVAKYIEECDDANYIQFDGCYQCKFECDPFCDVCVLGKCYKCFNTYTLINNICTVICGDGLITKGFEDCDDGNDLPFDGCYECQFQCYENCQNCLNGQCQDICEYGYIFQNNNCVSECGDGIITMDEECDDLNNQPFDGCFNCKYSCPLNCLQCDQGVCLQCDIGYYNQKWQCVSKCGDGIIALNSEECDDHNIQNLDGCNNNCMVEKNWLCFLIEDSQSECYYNQGAQLILQQYYYDYSQQEIYILFSQKVKSLKENYLEYIQASFIENLNCCEISISEIQPATYDLSEVKYSVSVKFIQQINFQPTLQVQLFSPLINGIQMPLLNQIKTIQLKLPKIMNSEQIHLIKINLKLKYIILKCSLYQFHNNLNQQIQSYYLLQQDYAQYYQYQDIFLYFLKFQIQFNNKLIQNLLMLKFHKIQRYILNLVILFHYNLYFLFQVLKIQALIILDNLFYNQSINFFNMTLILIFLKIQKLKQLFLLQCLLQNLLYNLYIIFSKITIFFNKMYISMHNQGTFFFLYTNSFDLMFISFLQLQNFHDNCRLITSIFIIGIVIYASQKYFNQSICSLFITFKKLLFISVLILFQQFSIAQITLLIIISISNCILKLYNYKLLNTSEIKQIISEFGIIIYLFMDFCYLKECTQYIQYQTQIIIGWVQIGVLSMVLFSSFIMEFGKYILQFLYKCKFSKKEIGPQRIPFDILKI